MANNENIRLSFQLLFGEIEERRNVQLQERDHEDTQQLAKETYRAAPFHSQISDLSQDAHQIETEKVDLVKKLEEITELIKQCEIKVKEKKTKIQESEMKAEQAVAELRLEEADEMKNRRLKRSREDEEIQKALDHLMATYSYVDFSPDYEELLKTLKLPLKNVEGTVETNISEVETSNEIDQKEARIPHNYKPDRTISMKDVGDKDIPLEYPHKSNRWYIIDCPVCKKSKFAGQKWAHGVYLHIARRHKNHFPQVTTRAEAVRWCAILIQDATEEWIRERNPELCASEDVDTSVLVNSSPPADQELQNDATPPSQSCGTKRPLSNPSSERPEKTQHLNPLLSDNLNAFASNNLNAFVSNSVVNANGCMNPHVESPSPIVDNTQTDLGRGIFRRLAGHKKAQGSKPKAVQVPAIDPHLRLEIPDQSSPSISAIPTPESSRSPETGVNANKAFDLIFLKCGTDQWQVPRNRFSFKYNSSTNGFEPFEGGVCVTPLKPRLVIPPCDVERASYGSFQGQGNGLILEKRRKAGEEPWADDGKVFQMGFDDTNEADRFLLILKEKNSEIRIESPSDRQRILDYEKRSRSNSFTFTPLNRSTTPMTSPDFFPDPPLIV